MAKTKDRIVTIILVTVLCVGVCLMLYPSVSNWWNSTRQSYVTAAYDEAVENLEDKESDALWREALAYNKNLAERGNDWVLSEGQRKLYESQLSLEGTEVMGYVEVPAIRCKLPIYHGTDEAVLQVAIGHIEGSSLPVGGEGSHCVISGHRGLASARLFTDLDRLIVGDVFMLTTMGKVLTYKVDQVRIVLPHQLEDLGIVKGEDLCTLVTCTPYGVNSHRLLVRGHRIENADATQAPADALRIDPLLVTVCLIAPTLAFLFAGVMLTGRKKKLRSESTAVVFKEVSHDENHASS